MWDANAYNHTHSDFDTHRHANRYSDFHPEVDSYAEASADSPATSDTGAKTLNFLIANAG